MPTTPMLTVARLVEKGARTPHLLLEVLSGRGGLTRVVANPHVQKISLALAGFHEYLRPGRILVFGESEVGYLETLTPEDRAKVLDAIFGHDIPCLLVTDGWGASSEVQAASERHDLPVLSTPVPTPVAITRVSAILDDALAVREVMHGVLMDILGLGVLIVGESGIGKSECALDLVVRGHRLVADDAVEVWRQGDASILGTCPELTRHHMEVRGLGIINIRDLYGVASTRTTKRVELVVQLDRWDTDSEYDRLGLDESVRELYGVRLPLIRMPVAPGRNLATLIEVAARNQLLRSRGLNAARDLVTRLERQLHDDARDLESEDEPDAGEAG